MEDPKTSAGRAVQGGTLWGPFHHRSLLGKYVEICIQGQGLARQVMPGSQKTQYREERIQQDTSCGLVSWCEAGLQRKHQHTP